MPNLVLYKMYVTVANHRFFNKIKPMPWESNFPPNRRHGIKLVAHYLASSSKTIHALVS